jgi:sulfopyruvate decarboxylase subunit beta
MRRYEVFQQLLAVLRGEEGVGPLVVCNIGYPSRELYGLGDQPYFFYMLGSMGLASSIGLGLALNTERRVVALDGDGSVLMNLGTLATIANAAPPNYTLLIIDNASYGSTGDQPTFTAGRTRLAEMARGAGVAQVFDAPGEEAAPILRRCLAEPGPQVIAAHVEPGSVPGQIIPLVPTAIRDRFMGAVSAR